MDKLSDEQNWKLLRLMRSYHNGENYEPNDFVVEIAFEQFKNQFDRDSESHKKMCERNTSNWAKWWRPRTETQNNPNNPLGYLGLQNNPNNPNGAIKKNKNIKKNIKEEDTYLFLSNDVEELFNTFLDQRKKREKGLSELAVKMLYNKLLELWETEEQQKAIINKSILNNWKSFFPIKLEWPQTEQEYVAVFKEIWLVQFRKKYGEEKANKIMYL